MFRGDRERERDTHIFPFVFEHVYYGAVILGEVFTRAERVEGLFTFLPSDCTNVFWNFVTLQAFFVCDSTCAFELVLLHYYYGMYSFRIM
jgi:hypothetical protein